MQADGQSSAGSAPLPHGSGMATCAIAVHVEHNNTQRISKFFNINIRSFSNFFAINYYLKNIGLKRTFF
jgi:hypothetical protein